MAKSFTIGSGASGGTGSSGSWSGSTTYIVTSTGTTRPKGNTDIHGNEVFWLESVTANGCSGGSAGLYFGSTTNATTAWNGKAATNAVINNASTSICYVYGNTSGARVTFGEGSGGWAYDNHGDSYAGQIQTQTVNWATVPSVPAGISFANVAGTANYTIGFTPSTDNGGSDISEVVQQYTVDARATWHTITTSTASPHTFSPPVTPGGIIQVQVYSVNGVGGSTARLSPVFNVPNVPNTPAAPKVTLTSTSDATVTWTAPGNGGAAIQSYSVALINGSTGGTIQEHDGITGTSYTQTGLGAGTAYKFEVKAVNPFGSSAWSAATAVTTASAPAAPAAPTGKATSASGIQWTWKAPASNGSAITSYTLQIFKAGVSQQIITGITATTYKTTGLLLSTAYTAEVLAVNAVGASSYSAASASVSTLAGNYPPDLELVNNTSSIFQVSVAAPTQFPGTETLGTGIQIQVSDDPTFATDVQTFNDTSVKAPATINLGNGSGDGLTWVPATYYFIQAAVKYNDGTWSDTSDPISLIYGGSADGQVGNGTTFETAQAYVGDGVNWNPITAFVGDGSTWQPLT